jgi:hypothetical protein
LAISGLKEKRAKGNRRPDDGLGYPFSGLRPRPSGSRHGSSGSGSGPGLIDSALCPRFSHPFISGGRWQPQVAGGRLFIQPSIQSSTQSSIQPSVIDSALCHRPSHLSSIQSSVHFGWPVAALGGGWRAFYSALHSVLNAVLRAVFSHPRSARSADPTPRQALPRYSILQTRYSQGPDPTRSTSTPARPTTPCLGRRIR